jgi:hypothetical protein
MGWGLE